MEAKEFDEEEEEFRPMAVRMGPDPFEKTLAGGALKTALVLVVLAVILAAGVGVILLFRRNPFWGSGLVALAIIAATITAAVALRRDPKNDPDGAG